MNDQKQTIYIALDDSGKLIAGTTRKIIIEQELTDKLNFINYLIKLP